MAALLKILNGERAQRPTGTPAMSDTLWHCVTEFWAGDPLIRPSSEVVVQNMIWPALASDTGENDSAVWRETEPKILAGASNDYDTALMEASTRGHVENVKELLAKGANPNFKSESKSENEDTWLKWYSKTTRMGLHS
jgi:ankyrin repeat protein